MVTTQAMTIELADVPAHRRGPARRTDAHDGAGDGVGGGDRHAEPGGDKQRHRPAGLGAEALHRRQLGDAGAHGARRCASRPSACPAPWRSGRSITTQNGTLEAAAEIALRIEQYGDDAHGLLGIVAAVPQRIERGRDELQGAEGAVDRKRR